MSPVTTLCFAFEYYIKMHSTGTKTERNGNEVDAIEVIILLFAPLKGASANFMLRIECFQLPTIFNNNIIGWFFFNIFHLIQFHVVDSFHLRPLPSFRPFFPLLLVHSFRNCCCCLCIKVHWHITLQSVWKWNFANNLMQQVHNTHTHTGEMKHSGKRNKNAAEHKVCGNKKKWEKNIKQNTNTT